MKRSEMIKNTLNHKLNTVCVTSEQVEVMLEVFEDLGMLPPYTINLDIKGVCEHRQGHGWDAEDEN
jgi:hypothetical protein